MKSSCFVIASFLVEAQLKNIKTTEELAQMIPNHKITVSESGINSKSDIERVQKVNVNAVLVGEALVSSKNPAEKLKELI